MTGAGEPVRLRLTEGQRHDMVEASALIVGLSPEYVLADKGYDSAALRKQIRRQKAKPVIPGRKGTRRRHDKTRYRNRNVVERFFNLLKHSRRVATRYEKTARNYLGFVQFAAIVLLL